MADRDRYDMEFLIGGQPKSDSDERLARYLRELFENLANEVQKEWEEAPLEYDELVDLFNDAESKILVLRVENSYPDETDGIFERLTGAGFSVKRMTYDDDAELVGVRLHIHAEHGLVEMNWAGNHREPTMNYRTLDDIQRRAGSDDADLGRAVRAWMKDATAAKGPLPPLKLPDFVELGLVSEEPEDRPAA